MAGEMKDWYRIWCPECNWQGFAQLTAKQANHIHQNDYCRDCAERGLQVKFRIALDRKTVVILKGGLSAEDH